MDRKSSYCSTVKNYIIKFHDKKAENPDWIVNHSHLLSIVAHKLKKSVDNLWKYGERKGRKIVQTLESTHA